MPAALPSLPELCMRSKSWLVLFLAACLLLLPSASPAQQYEPSVGQPGKDVIWVPTDEKLVEAMLDLAKVTPGDFLIDLGSGDGRIVIAAAKHGARALGVEYNSDMVALSRRNAEKAGVAQKASFEQADIFEIDLSKATVITMYLLQHLNLRLRPSILKLKPGTRVVSHAFDMGDWEADQTVQKEGRTAYLWIVPARVEGSWAWKTDNSTAELTLTQKFQKISGTLNGNGITNPILNGDQISFTAGNSKYSGRVIGNTIEGTAQSGGNTQNWHATLR